MIFLKWFTLRTFLLWESKLLASSPIATCEPLIQTLKHMASDGTFSMPNHYKFMNISDIWRKELYWQWKWMNTYMKKAPKLCLNGQQGTFLKSKVTCFFVCYVLVYLLSICQKRLTSVLHFSAIPCFSFQRSSNSPSSHKRWARLSLLR